jgi:hypothetical protein
MNDRAMSGDWAFRLPFLLQILPALMVGSGIHFFPFSPRWLALADRNEESLECLAKLRRLPATDGTVQLEWRGILAEDRFQKQILAKEHSNTGVVMMEIKQWLDLFRPRYIRRTFVAMAIPFFQQVCSSQFPLSVKKMRESDADDDLNSSRVSMPSYIMRQHFSAGKGLLSLDLLFMPAICLYLRIN